MSNLRIKYIICVFLNLFITESLATFKVVLDTSSDASFSWTIAGNYIYLPDGRQLLEFQKNFPPNFDFDSVKRSQGIWLVLPNPGLAPVSNSNDQTFQTIYRETGSNKVTFSFATSAQLLDSVTVKHNSGGHAIINIVVDGRNYTQTSEKMFSNWIEMTVDLNGKSRFSVEATVSNELDYIMIDRIEASFVETTTSTRRPKTTTEIPKNYGVHINNVSVSTFFCLFIVLLGL